jgi:hypothetical protein
MPETLPTDGELLRQAVDLSMSECLFRVKEPEAEILEALREVQARCLRYAADQIENNPGQRWVVA